MMGAGKSTVGSLVAESAGVPFRDVDAEIERTAGITIPEIFAREGEAGFRAREAEALRDAAGAEAVVACGGGAVLSAANVAEMRATGCVVWLEAPVEALSARVGAGDDRPLLTGAETAERLADIAAARHEAYRAAAHARVETAGRAPAEVAEEVMRTWRAFR
jgi:shikimate kinase